MNLFSLFSGIDGLGLGLQRAGMRIVGHVEIDPFCRRVLAKHWPEVPQHDDVQTCIHWWQGTDRPRVDVIAGGFPCVDISSANTSGTRAGLDGAKSGLWSAYRDVVAELEPEWVIVENSPEWRRWVPSVRRDLHALGYASVPVRVSAGSLGAPHPRPRCVVVANANGESEPLRALYAEVARLRPLPRGSGDWRKPFTGALRVADGSTPVLDRGVLVVDAHPGCFEEARAARSPSANRVRTMQFGAKPSEAPPRPPGCVLCGGALPGLPPGQGGLAGDMGAWTEAGQDLHYLQEELYEVQPFEREDVLKGVPVRARTNQRAEKVGRAAEDGHRRRAIGNAVVPAVGEYIGRMVMAAGVQVVAA